MHKNLKGIEKTVFGRGSFNQLGEIIAPYRSENNHYMVFFVDNYFKGKELESRLPALPEDLIYFIVEGGFELLWRVEHEILLLIHVESIKDMSEIG